MPESLSADLAFVPGNEVPNVPPCGLDSAKRRTRTIVTTVIQMKAATLTVVVIVKMATDDRTEP